MDRFLLAELAAIARDRRSGAAELAARAAQAVRSWLRRHPHTVAQELLRVAIHLYRAQPAMAPLLRLANEVARAAESENAPEALAKALAEFLQRLKTAPARIADRFARALRSRRRWAMGTYSYSSTVLRALVRSRQRIESVCCAESRPGGEGRAMARALARAGIRVVFMADALLFGRARELDLVVVGADALCPRGFVNKVGTGALLGEAFEAGVAAWLLVDTLKLWPESSLADRLSSQGVDPTELWPRPPARVTVASPYFELAPYLPRMHMLTERGWMDARHIRSELRKLRISPVLAVR